MMDFNNIKSYDSAYETFKNDSDAQIKRNINIKEKALKNRPRLKESVMFTSDMEALQVIAKERGLQ
jgi:uncharacterized pyridoxamine 5'-phosphate oxidase family protein